MVLRNVDNLVAIVRNFHLIDIKVQWQLARASIHAAGAIVDGGSILEEVRCLFEFSVAGGDLVYLARAAVLLDSISAASPAAVDGALRAITDSFVSCRPDAQYSLNQALLLSFFLRDLADLLVQHDGPARLRFICRWVDAITEQLRNACDDCEVASNMALKLKLTGEILVGDFTGIDLSGMVDAVIGCILVPFPDRPAVIRSVLPRCLQLLFRKNALDTHTLHACVSKFWILASADVAPDAHSSSLAAAILVQVGAEHDIELAAIFELNAFWDTVIRYFLHDDIVVRKRGAFLAQYFLSICHGAPGSDETSAPGGAAGSKRRLGRRGEREGCLDPDGCAVVAPTKRHWLHDFLAIYGQIEGCRYVHLVEQVHHSRDMQQSIHVQLTSLSSRCSVPLRYFVPCFTEILTALFSNRLNSMVHSS